MGKRPTTAQRGYGAAHQALRRALAPMVAAGLARCWRCGRRIKAGEPFDLGHDDIDQSRYRGPACLPCNRATSSRRIASQVW